MKVVDLKGIFKGLNDDFNIVFKIGEKKSYALTLIELDYNTKELIFREDYSVSVNEVSLTVKEVRPLLENIYPEYNVIFEDKEDADFVNINGIDISIWSNEVILKYNI